MQKFYQAGKKPTNFVKFLNLNETASLGLRSNTEREISVVAIIPHKDRRNKKVAINKRYNPELFLPKITSKFPSVSLNEHQDWKSAIMEKIPNELGITPIEESVHLGFVARYDSTNDTQKSHLKIFVVVNDYKGELDKIGKENNCGSLWGRPEFLNNFAISQKELLSVCYKTMHKFLQQAV
jgi:hypothetical protein